MVYKVAKSQTLKQLSMHMLACVAVILVSTFSPLLPLFSDE